MLLSVNLSDAKKLPQGAVQLELNWVTRTWSVAPDQGAWRRVGFSNRGPFETRVNGTLWLWDQSPGKLKTNTVIVWDGPVGPKDLIHKDGEGVLSEPRDAKLRDGRIKWALAAGAETAALRDQVRTLCEKNLPAFPDLREPPNMLESTPGKVKTPGGATGCGGFPGWMIQQLGADKFPKEPVTMNWTETVVVDGVKTQVPKSASVKVTSPIIAWEEMAKKIEKRRNAPGSIFIPFVPGSTRKPKTGDIYLLRQPNGWFRHVGVIYDATGPIWRTADGGQGKGFAVGFRDRSFTPATGKIIGEDKTDAFVKGWVDLEALVEKKAG
jgi:hypothetical protein